MLKRSILLSAINLYFNLGAEFHDIYLAASFVRLTMDTLWYDNCLSE